MGIKDDLLESDAQFISFRESINTIAKAENCSLELAFNWFKDKGLFNKQFFLYKGRNSFLIKPLLDYFFNEDTGKIDYRKKHEESVTHVDYVRVYDEDTGHVDYREKRFDDLSTHQKDEYYRKNLLNLVGRDFYKIFQSYKEFDKPENLELTLTYGFARKRFYDLLTINKVLINPDQWKNAKSYFEEDQNILTIEDYLYAHNANSEQVLLDRCECREKIATLEMQLLDAQANLLREKNLRELEKRNLVKTTKVRYIRPAINSSRGATNALKNR